MMMLSRKTLLTRGTGWVAAEGAGWVWQLQAQSCQSALIVLASVARAQSACTRLYFVVCTSAAAVVGCFIMLFAWCCSTCILLPCCCGATASISVSAEASRQGSVQLWMAGLWDCQSSEDAKDSLHCCLMLSVAVPVGPCSVWS